MADPVERAEAPPAGAYAEPGRPPRYAIEAGPRQARGRHRGRVASGRGSAASKPVGEEVAEFEHRPVACETTDRAVVLREEPAVGLAGMPTFTRGGLPANPPRAATTIRVRDGTPR
jgi:hypothetical protein